MKVKVIEYNVLNGFCGDKTPYKLNEKRLSLFIKFVKKENPDILILTEAYFFPFAKKDSLADLDKTFRDLYNENSDLAHNYFRWAPVILSKFEIENFDISFSKYHFNYLKANLKINGKKITIDVFHPHPDTTEEEKANFLEMVLKNKTDNYVLVGDFNSLSPEDSYDERKLIRGYESFMKSKGKAKVEDMLRGLVVKRILKNGLFDTYKTGKNGTDFTIPTDLMSRNKDAAARIDYIFASKNFKTLESGIIKNQTTEQISDHYPVYAVLEI